MGLRKAVPKLGALAATLPIVGGALAAPISGAELRSGFADAELRFSEGAFQAKDHLWLFSAAGAMQGVYITINTLAPHSGAAHREDNDTGTWSVEGNAACFQWRRWYSGAKRCFTVERQQGRWVKLTDTATGISYRGTLAKRR
ncbi:MAG: hypothetical protein ABFS30_07205 [Pseudomonadota bacterium]